MLGERDQKDIPRKYKYNRAPHIRPCSTHTTVLHTYDRAPLREYCQKFFGEPLSWRFFGAQGIDVSGENEMAHTVDLNFHQTTLESLENSFASNLG